MSGSTLLPCLLALAFPVKNTCILPAIVRISSLVSRGSQAAMILAREIRFTSDARRSPERVG